MIKGGAGGVNRSQITGDGKARAKGRRFMGDALGRYLKALSSEDDLT